MDCVFCKIVNNEIPSYKIYEDDLVIIFLDINPFSVGHTLIVPKKHTLDIETIDEDCLFHIMKEAKRIAKILVKKLDADGFTIVQNNGFVEEVKHFHLHVIPKYKRDIKMDIEEVYKKIME